MKLSFLKPSVLLLFCVSLFLISCEENPFRIDYSTVPDPYSIENANRVEESNGLVYYIVEQGSNDIEVTPRDQVNIHFTKRLFDNKDRIIQSTYANGNTTAPLVSVSGDPTGRINLAGFEQGIIGMKKGEKRVLVIPPDLAYGEEGTSTYAGETIWIDVFIDDISF